MALPRLSSSNLNLIRLPTLCSCSADAGEAGIKDFYWEKDSFILLYKRLERGVYQ